MVFNMNELVLNSNGKIRKTFKVSLRIDDFKCQVNYLKFNFFIFIFWKPFYKNEYYLFIWKETDNMN